ncbi:hypothetical protein B0H17DRAFT_1289482 [Mycena rosella]|uniref:Cleavage/polyadenylation specificity factor A subunit C-terminal domain-containing protein n=1 Tax=Mycena rosella TaxID=1033263 RepID=A0AAD7BJP4_MYCRO|nr:hypothetical protein B0H17DRAFT_1289482 [Mycena rosella]
MPSGVGSPPPSPSSQDRRQGRRARVQVQATALVSLVLDQLRGHAHKLGRLTVLVHCAAAAPRLAEKDRFSFLPAGQGSISVPQTTYKYKEEWAGYDLGKVDTEVDALPRMPMAPMQPNIAMQAKRQLAMLQDMIAEVKTVTAMYVQQAMLAPPYVKLIGQINVVHGSIMSDVILDNIFTDMAFHDKIKDSQRNVEAVQLNVGVLLPMCTARSERTSGYRSVHGAHSSSCGDNHTSQSVPGLHRSAMRICTSTSRCVNSARSIYMLSATSLDIMRLYPFVVMLTYYELGLGLNHIVRKWTMFVNIGLQNGVLLQTVLDPINGQLTDTRTRFLGTRPIRLLHVQIQQNPAILALSSRSWLNYMHQNLMHFTPLIFENFGFSAELSPEGLIRITGSTLRIFQIPKLGTKLKQDSMPLSYTPRKFIAHPTNHYFYMIEGDHHVLGPDAAAAKLDGLSLKIKYFDTVPVMSSLCILKSGFLFVAAEFGNHYVYRFQKLGNDDNEPEYSSTTYPSFSMSDPSSLLPHAYFRPRALENLVIADEIESIDPIIDSKVLNVLRYSDAQQIFTACRREAWSTFRTRHRLEVEESFGRQSGGKTQDDEYDSYIILSFANGTLVLSIGETIEEVQDTASTVPFQGAPELVDANRVEWQQHGL